MVDVVREADGDAAFGGTDQRVLDDLGDRRGEAQVVEREVERPLRGSEELGDCVRDLVRGLAAVAERARLDQDAAARCAALCARFAAW